MSGLLNTNMFFTDKNSSCDIRFIKTIHTLLSESKTIEILATLSPSIIARILKKLCIFMLWSKKKSEIYSKLQLNNYLHEQHHFLLDVNENIFICNLLGC